MVNIEEINGWLGGQSPSKARVDALAEEMPWWLLPAAMRLRNADDIGQTERRELLQRLSVGAPDLDQMSMAADADLAIDLAHFYPVERQMTPDTTGTIEKFLSTYGCSAKGEDEMLERLIFNPTPDYAQILAREEEQSAPKPGEAPIGSQDDIINSFIIKSKATEGKFPTIGTDSKDESVLKPQSEVQKPVVVDESMLSESLAKVYILQRKYQKAHEIISHLNLNFPQKSIYFADQLRFLEKLMAIEERKSMNRNKNNN